MNKIIAFSGSNSSTSINQSLVRAASKMTDNVEVIDLRDYDTPIYSMDLENESGIPESITQLLEKLKTGNAFIISTPEHNSLPPAFFKNILDWLSRTKEKPFAGGPILIMSTSPGGGGAGKAADVLAMVTPYLGADVISRFKLPSFSDNFNRESEEINNEEKKNELQLLLNQLSS
ncbi:NAD(P)H-dependent oxidoreductase [bacterium AH-315-B15]|nr:NAD(P)H-dependent oxidoreductase [bacterium AH-315-B15]